MQAAEVSGASAVRRVVRVLSLVAGMCVLMLVAGGHRRLVGRGIDLGAYTTTENAADFSDLRVALGIAEWNVYGVSYGTDLALTLMREHPEGIRSVTLDSVVPPQVVSPGGFWENAREEFNNLFAACASQRRCRKRHPELRQTFTRLETKDELIEAVVEARATQVRALLDALGRRRTPAARLKALARNWLDASDTVAGHGCPLGSLSVELTDHGNDLAAQAERLFADLIDWATEQFRELGCRDARDQAIGLISTVQGAALVSSTFHDPEILVSQVRRLERWIDSFA